MKTSSARDARVQAARIERMKQFRARQAERKMKLDAESRIPGRSRNLQLNKGAFDGWKPSVIVRGESPQFNGNCELFAIISTWNDYDIIEANVRNCLANGASRVYILDNDSSDDSVERAVGAGAQIGEIFKTEFYDDDLRIRKQNEIIRRVNEEEKLSDVWWVTLDADEFIAGQNGESALSTLSSLHPSIRTVGSNCVDLFPTGTQEYVIGEHPGKIFTHGIKKVEGWGTYCPAGHWKHVYLRYFNGVTDLCQIRGNHNMAGVSPVVEPMFSMPFFHAPYRRKEDMFRRLEMLCGSNSGADGIRRSAGDDQVTGNQGAIKRWKSLEHVYAQRWDQVEMAHSQLYGRDIVGIALYPWRVIFPELSGMFQ